MCEEQIHDNYIVVHGKGNKERVVPLSPVMAKQLFVYKRVRERYFNGNCMFGQTAEEASEEVETIKDMKAVA